MTGRDSLFWNGICLCAVGGGRGLDFPKREKKRKEDDMIRFKGRKEVGKYKYLSCPVYTVEYKRRNSSPRGGL